MRYSYVKLRVPVRHPGKPGDILAAQDEYRTPEFEMSDAGPWVRIKHVESGVVRLISFAQALCADEAPQEQASNPNPSKRR